MRKKFFFLFCFILISCGSAEYKTKEKIITVSIAPFKYFVEAIAGDDFTVNVMVPPGSDPHVYEPYPVQINMLSKSLGYISNGYLGFEMNWLGRFYQINNTMKTLSLGDKIDPIVSELPHQENHLEGADPHYWVSPKCAMIMASAVKDYLTGLNPPHAQKYELNYQAFLLKIQELDKKYKGLFSDIGNRSFMIYHPNLAYIARDYNLKEIPVEFEGKEPPPSRIRELIDMARQEGLKTIFVQKEYDTKNANAIAGEIGAKLVIIDPLSEDWLNSTSEIINDVYRSLIESNKSAK